MSYRGRPLLIILRPQNLFSLLLIYCNCLSLWVWFTRVLPVSFSIVYISCSLWCLPVVLQFLCCCSNKCPTVLCLSCSQNPKVFWLPVRSPKQLGQSTALWALYKAAIADVQIQSFLSVPREKLPAGVFSHVCWPVCYGTTGPLVQQQAATLHSTCSSSWAPRQTETSPLVHPPRTLNAGSTLSPEGEAVSQTELCWLGEGIIT